MDKVRELERLIPLLPNLTELNLNCTNLLAQLASPVEFFNTIEKSTNLKTLNIAAMSEDNEDAKKFKLLLRSVRRNSQRGGRIKYLNISENYMTSACFHSLKDILLKNRNIKTLKFYSQASDKFFNEMFIEMQRFFEEVIRKGSFITLRNIILSKGNKMKFKKEIADEKSVLYIGEGR